MQRSGTEAIRTHIQPSNLKREITKITTSQIQKPKEQLFPKRWPFSNPNRTNKHMNTRKVYRHRNYSCTCTTSPSVSEVIQNIYTSGS